MAHDKIQSLRFKKKNGTLLSDAEVKNIDGSRFLTQADCEAIFGVSKHTVSKIRKKIKNKRIWGK